MSRLLERSTLEFYGGIVLAIVLYSFPLTWWLVCILVAVIFCIIIDICLHSLFMQVFIDAIRQIIAFVCCLITLTIGGYKIYLLQIDDATRPNLRLTNMGIVHDPNPDDLIVINLNYKNVGKTPATHIKQASASLLQERQIDNMQINDYYRSLKMVVDKPPFIKENVPPGESIDLSADNIRMLSGSQSTRREIARTIQSKGRFLFLSLLRYEDESGRIYYLEGCSFAVLPSGFDQCDDHNGPVSLIGGMP